jgi:orotidine-5'-phosphate decarboxylase
VTALTSADAATLAEVGVMAEPREQVARLARLAALCGLDGVVTSPQEVELVRSVVARQDFVLVTPGVRPLGVDAHDQKRVMTPAEAVRAGADYLVVGRAILDANNPRRAAQLILEEMRGALATA